MTMRWISALEKVFPRPELHAPEFSAMSVLRGEVFSVQLAYRSEFLLEPLVIEVLSPLYKQIVSGSLSVDTRRVSTENAPEGDSKEIFKESGETFEIASLFKNYQKMIIMFQIFLIQVSLVEFVIVRLLSVTEFDWQVRFNVTSRGFFATCI